MKLYSAAGTLPKESRRSLIYRKAGTYPRPLLPRLVEATAHNFQMGSVLADKAYSSKRNVQAISDHGAMPYILFRKGFSARKDTSTMWSKLSHYYYLNREDFLWHYHLRSNAESTFSMIKAKFGERLWSKTEVAQTNEMLLKVVCHNICCVIRSMHELELEPTFWAASRPPQSPSLLQIRNSLRIRNFLGRRAICPKSVLEMRLHGQRPLKGLRRHYKD